jgi:hypothetical protein
MTRKQAVVEGEVTDVPLRDGHRTSIGGRASAIVANGIIRAELEM